MPRPRPLPVLSLSLVLSGCYLGYDSRWGEAKRAQQRAAQAATPESLHPSVSTTPTSARTFRARLYATDAYAQSTVDWQKQARDAIDEANRMLAPAVGVRIEVVDAASWGAPTSEQDLGAALSALAAADAGDGVELVVGFVGGMPRDATSFHEAGLAEVLGKHAVVRSAARLDEQLAVERGFYELSDEDKARLVRERARHRAVAVLLHEVGHILGAMHETDPHSLMSPRYDPKMQAFSLEATEMMHITVSHRAEGATTTERDDGALATDLLAYLEKVPQGPWVDGERDAEVARLEAMKHPATAVVSTPSSTAAPSATPVVDATLAAMSADDHARFDQASGELRDNHAAQAWKTAAPLFAKYPTSYAVQDLRCQLALLQRFDPDRTKAECEPLTRLSAKKGGT